MSETPENPQSTGVVADTGSVPVPANRPERIEDPPVVAETGNPTNVEVSGGQVRDPLMSGLSAVVTLARVGTLIDEAYTEQAGAGLPTDVLMIDATALYEVLGRELPIIEAGSDEPLEFPETDGSQ